jgi:hypothetical protein
MATIHIRPSGDITGATDYAAIQAALSSTSYSTVVLDGTYYVNATPTISSVKKTLVGTGWGTVITPTANTISGVKVDSSSLADWTIMDVHIGGFQVTGGKHAVHVTGATTFAAGQITRKACRNVTVHDVYGYNQADATIKLFAAPYTVVRGVRSKDAKYGVDISGQSYNCVLDQLQIEDFETYGIYFHGGYAETPAYGGHTLRVTNSNIFSGIGDGIYSVKTMTGGVMQNYPGASTHITNCAIESNSGYGINMNLDGTVISGCQIQSNSLGGVYLGIAGNGSTHRCDGFTVKDTWFENNSGPGISVATSTSAQVWNFTSQHNHGSGTGVPLVSATGANLSVVSATLGLDLYWRTTGTYRYEVGRTLNLSYINTQYRSYIDMPGSGEGGQGYQIQTLPAS